MKTVVLAWYRVRASHGGTSFANVRRRALVLRENVYAERMVSGLAELVFAARHDGARRVF